MLWRMPLGRVLLGSPAFKLDETQVTRSDHNCARGLYHHTDQDQEQSSPAMWISNVLRPAMRLEMRRQPAS